MYLAGVNARKVDGKTFRVTRGGKLGILQYVLLLAVHVILLIAAGAVTATVDYNCR